MNKEEYYLLLGLKKSDSVEELKSKYRNLAKRYHPDANPSGASTFLKIKEAYDWLIIHHVPIEYKKPLELDGKIKIYRFSSDIAYDITDNTYIVKIWESDTMQDGIIFLMDRYNEIRLEYKAHISSGSIATFAGKKYKIMVLEERF